MEAKASRMQAPWMDRGTNVAVESGGRKMMGGNGLIHNHIY